MISTVCIDHTWEPMSFQWKWLVNFPLFWCQWANYLTIRCHPIALAVLTVVSFLCLKRSLSTKVLVVLKWYCQPSPSKFYSHRLLVSPGETVSPFTVLQWHNCKDLSKFPTSFHTYRRKDITLIFPHHLSAVWHIKHFAPLTHAWGKFCSMKQKQNQTIFQTLTKALSISEKLKNNGSSTSFAIPCSGRQRTQTSPKYYKRGLFLQKMPGCIRGFRFLQAIGIFSPVVSRLWHLIF